MALIKCKECGTEVSSEAETCPKCGARVAAKPMGCGTIIGVIILGVVILAAFSSIFSSSTKTSSAPIGASSTSSAPTSAPKSSEVVPVREQLDYSKPVFTQDYAIVCHQGVLLGAAMDNRVDRGIDRIYEAFASIWNRSTKVKELGCEEWRGGIRVFARRMKSPFSDFVGISLTANDGAMLFTMEPHLTNSGGINESKAEQEVTPEEANRRGFDANERKDYADAKRWWQQAANGGFAKAQHNLAVLYTEGRGVPKDYLEAARLYRLAANQGFPAAQYSLGVLYESGAGVEKDETLARSWYLKAAEQGDTNARKALADLDSKVRPPIGHRIPTTQDEGLQVTSPGQGAQPYAKPDAAQ